MIPIDVDPDQARDAALRELSDPAYRSAQPSWFDRATGWVLDRIGELFSGIGSLSGGGIVGLLVLIGLAILLVVIIRHRVGRLARTRASRPGLFEDRTRTAEDHRRAAETAVSQGNLAEAIRERFRAIVRELEQRGVLDEVSGRTVDEIAASAGHALPDSAEDFRAAAAMFDDVVYGGRPATTAGYGQLVALDDDIQGIQRRTLLGVPR